MHNILIVDDEMIMCDYLEKVITELKPYNINLVAVAHNVREALDVIKGNDINLVITDIVMPEANGIELIQQTALYDKRIKFIVLSGYDDFNYVQTAYRLGVIDYILKTSISADYLKTLILSTISDTQNEGSAINPTSFKNSNFREKFILQQNRLSYLFTNDTDEHITLDKSLFPVAFNSSIRLLYITLFMEEHYVNTVWKNDYTSIKLGCINIIQELIDQYGIGFAYAVDFSHYALVLDESIPPHKLFAKLLTSFKTYFKIRISGVLSDSVDSNNPYLISSLYDQCKHYAPYYFYIGKDIVFSAKDFEFITPGFPLNINLKIKELQNFFDSSASENALEVIDKISIYDKKYSLSDLKKLYLQYAYAIENFCQSAEIPDAEVARFFSIKETGDLIEYNQWLKNTLVFIHDSKIKDADIIDKIKIYTENNCKDNLSLDHIAATFNISKWYFCRLFQQKTNMTFNSYLSLCRTEKAKRMLLEGTHKISNIASECGYSSTEHFSRSFKKITGQSPSQYQKKN